MTPYKMVGVMAVVVVVCCNVDVAIFHHLKKGDCPKNWGRATIM